MLKQVQFWSATGLALLCLVLVVVNFVTYASNHSHQQVVNARNQYVQQTRQLQTLYQQMVRTLADLSVKNNDPALRALLAKQGIKVTVNQKAPVAAAQPAAPASGKTASASGARP